MTNGVTSEEIKMVNRTKDVIELRFDKISV